MSIKQGGKTIAGATFNPTLLDFKWADHILDDISWLRADTFSWQAGSVYSAVYQHLANDINGKTLQSETISGTTIQFYLSDDGHKVCPDSQESNVAAIYTATGVAWYYILDTTNQRFKLPRTKFAFTGLRDVVGNYIAPGIPAIPEHTHTEYWPFSNTYLRPISPKIGGVGDGATKSLQNTTPHNSYDADGSVSTAGASTRTGGVYGASSTVQPPATQMYLYFYVGNFTQSAIQETAGLNAELFNGKVDKGHQVVEFQAPTSVNNYTWYRKYADGWVEQGGVATVQVKAVSLPVAMSDSNYVISGIADNYSGVAGSFVMVAQNSQTTTGFTIAINYYGSTPTTHKLRWFVCGMAE